MRLLADVPVSELLSTATAIQVKIETLRKEHADKWSQCSGRMFDHCLNTLSADLNIVIQAVKNVDAIGASWAARSLLELTFIFDYLARSSKNRDQFVMESMCDTLYLMRTLNDYEAEREGYQVNLSIEDSIRALEMTTDSNCQKSGSRTVRMIAIELNRVPEYVELYRFLSKMSHPTPWSMIGTRTESTVTASMLSGINTSNSY